MDSHIILNLNTFVVPWELSFRKTSLMKMSSPKILSKLNWKSTVVVGPPKFLLCCWPRRRDQWGVPTTNNVVFTLWDLNYDHNFRNLKFEFILISSLPQTNTIIPTTKVFLYSSQFCLCLPNLEDVDYFLTRNESDINKNHCDFYRNWAHFWFFCGL